jgi:hypothetical protein
MTGVLQSEWTLPERRLLEEAKRKLEERKRTSAIVCAAGVVLTAASFVVFAGGGLLFFAAIVVGAGYAIDADQRVKKLYALQPGTPLNASTLGIRTSADPPTAGNRTALIVLASVIAAIVLLIVGALIFG